MFCSPDILPGCQGLIQTGPEEQPLPQSTDPDLAFQSYKTELIPKDPFNALELNDFWIRWQKHRNALYYSCLRWLNGNVADAEDALSQACIRAARKFSSHRKNIRNLNGWLIRLTFNICMDMQRERERHASVMRRMRLTLLEKRQSHQDIPRYQEDRLLSMEIQDQLRKAMDSLPCRLRLPASLRFFENKSYREIAETLMITQTNARKRIQLARAELKERLAPYLNRRDGPTAVQAVTAEQNSEICEIPTHANSYFQLGSDKIEPHLKPHQLVTVLSETGDKIQFYLPIGPKPKRIEQRINTLRKYCTRHPRTIKKCLELAELLYLNGDWLEAIAHYKRLLNRKPELFQLWLRLGEMQHLMGSNDQAIQAFLRARRITASLASRYHVTGLINICRNQHNRALRAFEIAIIHESENSAHRHAAGIVIQNLGHPAGAARVFEQVLRLNPHDGAARIHLFEALMMLKQPCQALRQLKIAISLKPNDALAVIKLAGFRVARRREQGMQDRKTKRIIRQALALTPDSIDARTVLANYYLGRGKLKKGTKL